MKWFVALVALAAGSFAHAQFPAKPVRMVQERFATRGIAPKPSTPEGFDAFVRTETAKLAKVIAAAGVKAN